MSTETPTKEDHRVDTKHPLLLIEPGTTEFFDANPGLEDIIDRTGPNDVLITIHLVRGVQDLDDVVRDNIPEVENLDDMANASIIAAKGKTELGEVGRIRKGRVDTGHHFINNLFGVCADLRVSLTNCGYSLAKVGRFTKPDGRIVIQLIFRRGLPTDKILDIMRGPLQVAMRNLMTSTYQFCHCYNNPPMNPINDERNATINLVGIMPEGTKPSATLYIKDRALLIRFSDENESTEES